VDGQLLAELLGQVFVDVLLVLPRQDDLADAHAPRRQHLFLDAADGQHASGEGNLAGHGDVAAHRATRQLGGERRRHGDAGGRTVLRDGARGHVQVKLRVLEEVGIGAEGRRVGAEPRERRARGFLHHVAELTGERE